MLLVTDKKMKLLILYDVDDDDDDDFECKRNIQDKHHRQVLEKGITMFHKLFSLLKCFIQIFVFSFLLLKKKYRKS